MWGTSSGFGLSGCGGILGSCGPTDTAPWSEVGLGPNVEDPNRFVFSLQEPTTEGQSFADWLKSYSTTGFLLFDFFHAHGRTERTYTANDYRTRNFAASAGIRSLVRQINERCEAGIFSSATQNEELLTTARGGFSLFIGGDAWMSIVGGQVGGYRGSWTVHNNVIDVRVHNVVGAQSFFYHAVPDAPATWRGPFRNIVQDFTLRFRTTCGGAR